MIRVTAPRHDPFHRNFRIQCHRCDFYTELLPVPEVVDVIVGHVQEAHPDVDKLEIRLTNGLIGGWPRESLN